MVLFTNAKALERGANEVQFIHLFEQVNRAVDAAKANMDEWEKKVSCYNVGRLQILAKITQVSTNGVLKSTKKNVKMLNKMVIRANQSEQFCINKTQQISLNGLYLNSTLRQIKKINKKLNDTFSSRIADGLNVKIGLNSARLSFHQSLRDMTEKFTNKDIYVTETEVNGHLYKPQLCLEIGRLVTSFEMYKVEASRANKYTLGLIEAEDSIYDLRDLCFNQRGLAKYLREIKQVKEIISQK